MRQGVNEEINGCVRGHSLGLLGFEVTDIEGFVKRYREAGGTFYLRKPVDPDVLVELVDKALWMPHLLGHQTARPRALGALND